MKFTYNWLKEFVELNLPPADLARALTMAGLEIESLTKFSDAQGSDDWLLEAGVTPNRGDCLSVAGIAREVGALTRAKLTGPPSDLAKERARVRQKRVQISIENHSLCARYSARVIDNVKGGSSPAWLRRRLELCGIRAINAIVDVTNYVMLETGQPLHAFDLDRLRHKTIAVKASGAARTFTTLDGVERQLGADDLLIFNGPEPVALAGVMGGLDTEVRDSTTSVLLESANFSPVSIRRTARRLGLHSEASHRFERGVDPAGTVAALNRAAYLLRDIAQGLPAAGSEDRYPGKSRAPTILLREARIERVLGMKLDRGEVIDVLLRLGMAVKQRRGVLAVVPPSSRTDLRREADLIEELARLRGYDRIPSTLPPVKMAGSRIDEQLTWERRLRGLLAEAGLSEVINLPFTAEALNRRLPGLIDDLPMPVMVQNPLAKDAAEMRRSLLPGLIGNLRFNLSFKARACHLFHLGKVFGMTADQIGEKQCIAGVLYGPRERHGLRADKESPEDFFDLKGLVQSVLGLFRLEEDAGWEPFTAELLHPGKSARVSHAGDALGYLGQIHPQIAQELELPMVFLFELDFTKLLQYAPRRITVHALPRFPAIERDVALVVDRNFASEHVIRWIRELGEPLIEHIKVFDQYVGAPIAEGKKSLAYKISYRAGERTLTDAEVNELHQSLVERLRQTFGVERRS